MALATSFEMWIYGEWDTIGLIKERHLEQPDLIISDITPYFQPFSTLISKLCLLLSKQVNYMKTLDGHEQPGDQGILLGRLFGLPNHGAAQEEHCKQGETRTKSWRSKERDVQPTTTEAMEDVFNRWRTLSSQPVNVLAPQPAKHLSKPKLIFETLQLQSLKQAISPMTNSPLIQVDTLAKPRGRYGFASNSCQPDEDWDGDDGYDDSLRPDSDNIDREVHDQEYDNEEGQEYDNEEGGWDDGMNGPGDANNSKNADELFGLSGIDVDQFLDLANCHTGPGTLEVDDPHLHNPLIDVQDNQYLTRTNIGHHQLQSLTATLSIDPPIVLILSPMYHPTIVNGTTVMSSPNNSLPTATTIAVLLSLKHNHLVTINVLQFYPPVYRDLLEKAKKRSRLESLNNSFPHHETFLAEDVIEILAELHDQFAAEGCSMEEGYWESYKHNMAIILWDDLGNMHSKFKSSPPNCSKSGHTNNLAHIALEDLCKMYYYMGAVALAATIITLDEYRMGVWCMGKLHVDMYRPIHEGILSLMDQIKKDWYHESKCHIIDDTCTSAKTEAPKTHTIVFQAVLN
ncbi:hypothetical protein BDR07DRAFT_1386359 [Suillus spraguei]|nr:hypothetical protein BDR07DRAFT_1386359 [Suillus spraguei]